MSDFMPFCRCFYDKLSCNASAIRFALYILLVINYALFPIYVPYIVQQGIVGLVNLIFVKCLLAYGFRDERYFTLRLLALHDFKFS